MEAIKYCNHCIQGWNSFVSCRLTQLVQQTFESVYIWVSICTHSSTVTHTLNFWLAFLKFCLCSTAQLHIAMLTRNLPEACQLQPPPISHMQHAMFSLQRNQISVHHILRAHHHFKHSDELIIQEKDFIQFLSGTATYIWLQDNK